MKIKWPEKMKEYQGVSTFNAGERFGYNAAIEACQKAVEEAKGEGLVELDVEAVAKFSYEGYSRDCKATAYLSPVKFDKWEDLPTNDKMRMVFIDGASRFCSKFGTPKPRPVVTADEITNLAETIFRNYHVPRYPKDKLISQMTAYEQGMYRNTLMIAQAIVKHLGQGE